MARLKPCPTVVLLVLVAACAPALAPPPTVTTPRYPDFLFPAVPPALATRELVNRQQRGWQFLQAGDLAGARREFGAALRRNPNFYPAETALGYASLAEKNYPDAAARFEKVVARAPRDVAARVGLGDALVGAGRLQEATKQFEAALAQDPSLTDIRRRLEVLALRGQQESLTAARRATEAGRLDEAAAEYRRAITASPESGFLYRELAGVERRQGRTAEALEHLKRAVAIDPADARALLLTGEILEEQGQFAQAIAAYTRAQEIEPGDEVASHLARARSRVELSRLPEQYRAIASSPQITRGELAALIGVRLQPLLADSASDGRVATDVRTHWAAPWILAVIRAGVMEPFPNHTFQPRGLVRRLDMAQVATRLLNLAAARQPGAGRDWAEGRPRIPDLPPTHLGYPAAAMVVSAGLMPLQDGLFRPSSPVSGAEAVEIVGRLEELAR